MLIYYETMTVRRYIHILSMCLVGQILKDFATSHVTVNLVWLFDMWHLEGEPASRYPIV